MQAYYQYGNSEDGTKINLYLNKQDIDEMRQYLERLNYADSIQSKLIDSLLKELDDNA